MMGSDRLNRWLSLAANIGVIAGLVLVAYEIDQSSITLELATSSDGVDNFQQAMEVLVQDEDFARLIYKAETEYEGLDEFEKWRVSKYLDGYFPLPMYRDYWSKSRQRLGPDFRRYIDDVLLDIEGR